MLLAFAAVDAVIAGRVGWPPSYASRVLVPLLVLGLVLFIAITVLTRAALPAGVLRWAATLAAGAGLYIASSVASVTLSGLLVGGALIVLTAAEAPVKPVFMPMPGQHFTVTRIT
jgi:hypothetical protein